MWTLEQGFESCYQEHWARGRNRQAVLVNWRAVHTHFGAATPLEKITTPLIYAWLIKLRITGNSQSTINNKRNLLSKIMSHAVLCGELPMRPMFPPQPRVKGGRDRFLTDEEETLSLSALHTPASDVFILLMDTGARPSELWTIRQRDWWGYALTIWDTKTGKPRTVPTTERVRCILERRCLSLAPDALIFPYSTIWFEKVWNRMKRRIGLGDDKAFIPYALRHTCASRLLQGGEPLANVQLWLGHTSIITTMRYAHLAKDALKNAVKHLERGKNTTDVS